MSDLISRQAAIDALNIEDDNGKILTILDVLDVLKSLPSAQPEKCEDAVSREEAKWVVFCHRDHVEDQVNAIDELPSVRASAQEVVRCKDCKWWDNEDDAERCTHKYGGMWAKPCGFCSYGERADK